MNSARYITDKASLTDLRYKYRAWLIENDLSKMSAESLLNRRVLTKQQQEYLRSFILRWVQHRIDQCESGFNLGAATFRSYLPFTGTDNPATRTG